MILIYKSFSIPVEKQRLIFQGKLLKDLDKLTSYKISDNNVIHLVAKSIVEEPNNETSTNRNII